MAEDLKHPDGERRDAPMLEYRAAAADRVPGSGVQMLGGFIVGMVVIGGGTFVGALAGLVSSGRKLEWICFLCSGLVVNLVAAVNYGRPPTRAYGVGLWIGFGVASVGFAALLGLGR
jgi:hypothetical protein